MPAIDRFSIEGRTALVTGASYGLGEVIAKGLAEAGANVVVAARSKERLEQVAEAIESGGGSAMPYTCDVTDSSSVSDLVDAAWRRFGRVDILVSNAGVTAEGGVMPERVTDEQFNATIAVNLHGTYWCNREVGKRQLADGGGGSIINVSSVLGLGGQHNFPVAYQASKAAVLNITRNLAASWADRGVRVNAIAPGWFPSEMTAPWFAVPQFLERFSGQAPMGRVGDPEELLGAVLFLASDASSFVTGQTLVVDGGLSATIGAPNYTDEQFDLVAQVMGELGQRITPGATA
ncbi:MAG: SDR family NAD(P)-dependent oxidoreductase [Acidimicrobiales bacterium]